MSVEKLSGDSDCDCDEAYRLYCRSRCGDTHALQQLQTNSPLTHSLAHSLTHSHSHTHTTSITPLNPNELIWEGYHGSALFYAHHDYLSGEEHLQSKRNKAIIIFQSILPALTAAVQHHDCSPHIVYLLGWYYNGALGVETDHNKAFKLFSLAAKTGLAIAQSNLGICYTNGYGVPKSAIEASRQYRLAADQGHTIAQFNLGISCLQSSPPNDPEAVARFRQAADQGFGSAIFLMGMCYESGRGLPPDHTRAIELYKEAVAKGCDAAQCTLAQRYECGLRVPRDVDEAFRLMKSAADRGFLAAQFNIGKYFVNGVGVESDIQIAIKYFCQAAAKGDTRSAVAAGECYKLSEDYIQAAKWYSKAIEMGSELGQELLQEIDESYRQQVRHCY